MSQQMTVTYYDNLESYVIIKNNTSPYAIPGKYNPQISDILQNLLPTEAYILHDNGKKEYHINPDKQVLIYELLLEINKPFDL